MPTGNLTLGKQMHLVHWNPRNLLAIASQAAMTNRVQLSNKHRISLRLITAHKESRSHEQKIADALPQRTYR